MYHYTFIGKLDVQNTLCIIGVKWLFSLNNSGLTVFLSLERGDMLSPAMMAIKELKLPMLKHSRAVSIQNSTTLTRCFFLACWKPISPLIILQQFFLKKSSKQSASTIISSTFYSKTWIENQFFFCYIWGDGLFSSTGIWIFKNCNWTSQISFILFLKPLMISGLCCTIFKKISKLSLFLVIVEWKPNKPWTKHSPLAAYLVGLGFTSLSLELFVLKLDSVLNIRGTKY